MKRSRIGISAVTAVVALGVFGGGTSAAIQDLTGMTYGKAAEQVKSWNWTPVIASVVGDQLALDDCIVTSSGQAANKDSSGRSRGGQLNLNLNCNAPLAAPGKPGMSAASPQGREVKAKQEPGIKYSQDYEWAVANGVTPWCEDNSASCKQVCDESGSCSDDLVQFITKTMGIQYSKDYDYALANGIQPWCRLHAMDCKKVCADSGTCSQELSDYLFK